MIPRADLLTKLLRRPAWSRANAPFRRKPMHLEEIEPRILHSADLAPFALLDSPSPLAQVRVVEADTAAEATSMAEASRPRELVILDASTPDYLRLADDIRAQAEAGRRVELVIVESGADGIRDISEALSRLDGIEAVHIISHGSDGALRLGATSLNAAALQSRGAEIGAWSRALSADADLLIYGCDVAATAEGRAFVGALARVTGADVAASDDLTGSAVLGGDWLLEYHAGQIEASIATTATAQQAWQATLAAPVLTGTNNLPTINEDPTGNNGIKVSDLIAGRVTDADPGALSGIAATGVDNTNGQWQYTTNGGGAWTAFGAVSETSARLLTDNANTSVRFVPNANWNGTLIDGITFRAWDQTSGTAGSTANVGSSSFTLEDTFNVASYSNNNGTASWTAGWNDSDGDFSGGQIRVSGNALTFDGALVGGASIERQANLTGATNVTLTFDFNNQLALGNTLTVEVAGNGQPYQTLANAFSSGVGNANMNISSTHVGADTRIRFTIGGLAGAGTFTVDNVKIAYDVPLNGGTTAFSSATAAADITVTSVNDRPVGTDATLVTAEDTPLILTAASFGFTDPADTPANSFIAVKINTLPAAGVLTLNGAAVTAGQTISRADLDAGNLSFVPALNANGAGYASFTFKVQDNGGGADTDSANRTLTINVTPGNDAPVGTDRTVTAVKDTSFVFTTAMFGYTDPSDAPANTFVAVTIQSLPVTGSLQLNGAAVNALQSISVADITAGRLRFDAAPGATGAGYASFTFRVQDNGAGANLDTVARTMTIDVAPRNNAPTGADRTVLALEDTTFVFAAADFGYSDANDSPANNFIAVKIETLPGAGTLLLNGVAVGAGTHVSLADITAGKLAYSPAADGNGAGYASFTFRVQDDGGVAGGGIDLDATARTLTVDVASVNDAPKPAAVVQVAEVIGAPVVVQQQMTEVRTSSGSSMSSPTSSSSSSAAASSATAATAATASASPEASVGGSESAAGRAGVEPEIFATGATAGAGASGAQFVQVGVQRLDSQQTMVRDARTVVVAAVAQDAQALIAPDRIDVSGSSVALSSSIPQAVATATSSTIESRAMAEHLDQMRDGLQEHAKLEASVTAASAAAGMSLSVGYVVWMLRGGVLVSTLLSSLPAWRLVDPLPVLGRMDDDGDDDGDGDDADDSLGSLVARNNAASDEPAAEPDSSARKAPT